MAIFYLRTGDTPTPIRVKLINVDGTYNPTSNVTNVKINIIGRGKYVLQKPAIITDSVNSIVQYNWTTPDIATMGKGTYNIEFIVTYTDNSVFSFPNNGEVLQLIVT